MGILKISMWLVFSSLIVGACDMNITGKKTPDAEEFFKDSKALALAHAIEKGDIKAIRKTVVETDINKQHFRGMTFLNWAFAHSNFESAEALVELGADPHIETEGVSPLSWAMDFKEVRWLKLLVESGADIDTKGGTSPLWFDTIISDNWEHFDYLLSKGVDLSATNKIGETVIFSLAEHGSYQQVLKLIEKGVDVNVVLTGGLSFAHLVQESEVASGHPEYENREKVIKILEKEGYRFPVLSPKEVRKQWEKD